MTKEIVDFPIKNEVIFHSHVSLPEGTIVEGMKIQSPAILVFTNRHQGFDPWPD